MRRKSGCPSKLTPNISKISRSRQFDAFQIFHIVGTVLNTAYPFADMNPAHALNNVQTVSVPAGGGGVFDVKIDKPGLYPFVSHAFAAVDQGQVGLLKVGDVKGTMSH